MELFLWMVPGFFKKSDESPYILVRLLSNKKIIHKHLLKQEHLLAEICVTLDGAPE